MGAALLSCTGIQRTIVGYTARWPVPCDVAPSRPGLTEHDFPGSPGAVNERLNRFGSAPVTLEHYETTDEWPPDLLYKEERPNKRTQNRSSPHPLVILTFPRPSRSVRTTTTSSTRSSSSIRSFEAFWLERSRDHPTHLSFCNCIWVSARARFSFGRHRNQERRRKGVVCTHSLKPALILTFW